MRLRLNFQPSVLLPMNDKQINISRMLLYRLTLQTNEKFH